MKDDIGKLDHLRAIYYSRQKEKYQPFSNVLNDRRQTATDIFTSRTSAQEQHKNDPQNN